MHHMEGLTCLSAIDKYKDCNLPYNDNGNLTKGRQEDMPDYS